MIGFGVASIVVLAVVVWWTRKKSNSYYRLIRHENMEPGEQRRHGMRGFFAEAGFLISIILLVLAILGTLLHIFGVQLLELVGAV